jgi:hypothetical protein
VNVFLSKIKTEKMEIKEKHTKTTISLPPKPTSIPIQKPSLSPPKHDMTPKEQKEFLQKELQQNEDFPSELPIQETIGKSDLMFPRTYAHSHVAAPLLYKYAKEGCTVDCGPDWNIQKIMALLRKGPHSSAKSKDAIRQLRAETKAKIKNGYARVVNWKDIKNDIPKNLKISPVAMIPHKSKKYRCILDLSFTLHEKGLVHSSVNATTNKKAPPQAMSQLGLCLSRLIANMADNYDRNAPFMFTKLDIKDGFWRMRVSDADAWNFCYVLPSLKDNDTAENWDIVVPNSLQMGWCESPPFFCAGSETARDIITNIIDDPTLPHHRFETIMLKDIVNESTSSKQDTNHTTIFEVFVDDFIASTNNISQSNLQKISRAMINGIHSIFPPPEITTHNGGDPIAEKKLHNGDGTWSHTKEILGWDFDGKEFTIQLPPAKCDKIINEINKLIKMKRASLNKFQKIGGKLQHASFGIPNGRSLFSPIQQAMANSPSFINITPQLKDIFMDWRYIISFLKRHPTSVLQLVTNYPDYVGYSDACRLGAGGTWSSGLKAIPPILWQVEWPIDIQNSLITDNNKNGTLTINDLEQAGLALNWLVLECQKDIPLAFHHVGMFCDNMSAVIWTQKMRTSASPVAGRLLRLLGMRIHARQSSGLTPIHIAGDDNQMSDIISRAFRHGKFFHAQNNLTSYFNSHFPLQEHSWTEFHLPTELTALVISCLRGVQLPLERLLRLPVLGLNTGVTGASMSPCSNTVPASLKHRNLSKQASSSALLGGSGQALTVAELKSKFRRSRTRSRPSARPLAWPMNRPLSTKKGVTKATSSQSKG